MKNKEFIFCHRVSLEIAKHEKIKFMVLKVIKYWSGNENTFLTIDSKNTNWSAQCLSGFLWTFCH